MTIEEVMKMNEEWKREYADLESKYQRLRLCEMAQLWIIGAMSGALIVFGLSVLTQL